MLNQIILVGRLTSDLEVKEEEGRKVSDITIAIPRSYKNSDGEYETDFVSCKLFGSVAENTAGYCKKGDIIGVKGRIEAPNGDMKILAEKITFLSSNSKKEDE